MGVPANIGVAASGILIAGEQANTLLTGQFTAVGPSQPIAIRGPLNVAIFASLTDALTTTAGSLSATAATGTGLQAGDAIKSTLVPPGTTVGAISGATVTLVVPPVTYYGKSRVAPLSQLHGLPVTAGLVGATVTGPNIPAGDTVLSVVRAAVPATANSPLVAGQLQLASSPTADTPLDISVPFTFYPTGNAILASGTDNAAYFTGSNIVYSGSVQLERSFDGGNTWVVVGIGGDGTMAIYNAGTPVSAAFGEPEKEVLWRMNCTAWTSGTINFRISATGQAAESLGLGLLS